MRQVKCAHPTTSSFVYEDMEALHLADEEFQNHRLHEIKTLLACYPDRAITKDQKHTAKITGVSR